MSKRLEVMVCDKHNFYAVMVNDDNGFGTRITPSKCCGSWRSVRCFDLSARDWHEMSELAEGTALEIEAEKKVEKKEQP